MTNIVHKYILTLVIGSAVLGASDYQAYDSQIEITGPAHWYGPPFGNGRSVIRGTIEGKGGGILERLRREHRFVKLGDARLSEANADILRFRFGDERQSDFAFGERSDNCRSDIANTPRPVFTFLRASATRSENDVEGLSKVCLFLDEPGTQSLLFSARLLVVV